MNNNNYNKISVAIAVVAVFMKPLEFIKNITREKKNLNLVEHTLEGNSADI